MFKILFSLVITLGWANEPITLRSYINDFPKLSDVEKDKELLEISELLAIQKSQINEFYDGPKDTGEANTARFEWEAMDTTNSKEALQLVASILEMPALKFNSFTLQLFDIYQNEPESRPAIKEVIMALKLLRFNETRLNQIDSDISWKTTTSSGFVTGGFLGVGALCLFRITACRSLVRNNKIYKTFITGGKKKGRKTKDVDRFYKLLEEDEYDRFLVSTGVRKAKGVKTVGSKLVQESHYSTYYRYNQIKRMDVLKYFVGYGAGGAVGFTIWANADHALTHNKMDPVLFFEPDLLDPVQMERLYFSSLAILELTCAAKDRLSRSESLSREELRDFLLDVNSQKEVLVRMAGSRSLFQKRPLNFVTARPDTGEISIEIPLMEDYTYESVRSCPGIQDTGEAVSSSLGELEYVMDELIEVTLNKE